MVSKIEISFYLMEKTAQFCCKTFIDSTGTLNGYEKLKIIIKIFWHTDKCLWRIDTTDGIRYNRDNYFSV